MEIFFVQPTAIQSIVYQQETTTGLGVYNSLGLYCTKSLGLYLQQTRPSVQQVGLKL